MDIYTRSVFAQEEREGNDVVMLSNQQSEDRRNGIYVLAVLELLLFVFFLL